MFIYLRGHLVALRLVIEGLLRAVSEKAWKLRCAFLMLREVEMSELLLGQHVGQATNSSSRLGRITGLLGSPWRRKRVWV